MSIASFIRTKLVNVLSFSSCAYCGDDLVGHTVLCELCRNRIERVEPLVLPLTSHQNLTVHAVGSYQEPLKSLILAKRQGNRDASKQLGELVWHHTMLSQLSCDNLIPIPLHWSRHVNGGYNHAEVMAQQIAQHNYSLVTPALIRVRCTALQTGLRLHDRHINLQSAFALSNDVSLKDKHVILVDDLVATGVTLTESARVLLHAKPASITAVVACCVI